jgi:hypothetical protein
MLRVCKTPDAHPQEVAELQALGAIYPAAPRAGLHQNLLGNRHTVVRPRRYAICAEQMRSCQ